MSRVMALALPLMLLAASAGAQGRVGSNTPGQQAFDQAMKALNADDFAAAQAKFRQAIELDPTNTDAYWRLAAIYYREGQYTRAVELLGRCPDRDNLDVKEQLGLNLYLKVTPPPHEAVALLEEVARKRPESFAVQLQLGQHLLRTDPRAAAAAFEAYFRWRPSSLADSDTAIRMRLGTAYVLGKQWQAAEREFSALVKARPHDLQAKLMLGSALVGRGACAEAIALHERLLGEADKQPSIRYNLGVCYLKQRRAADAVRQAERYANAKAADAKGQVLLGDALVAVGDLERALAAFQRAARLEPSSALVHTRLGKAQLLKRHYAAARRSLEQAQALTPDDPEALGALAETYAAMRVSRPQLGALADKLAAMTRDPQALAAAGRAYYALENDERAASAYVAALTLEPDSAAIKTALVKVYNRLSGSLLQRGEGARAELLLADAARLEPGDRMTLSNLAIVELELKRFRPAEETARAGLRQTPHDLGLARLLGRALLGQGEAAAARPVYENAARAALKARAPELPALDAELGVVYLETRRTEEAVAVLERAVQEGGNQAARHNLAVAYFRRGLEQLKRPDQAEAALEDFSRVADAPAGIVSGKERAAATCGRAFAALKAGKGHAAEAPLAAAMEAGGCVLNPPYDRLGLGLFVAYAAYRDGHGAAREAALKTFSLQLSRVAGATAEWLRQLMRSGYELLAYDAYQRGETRRARAYLHAAARAHDKSERRELDHNLAVLDLNDGLVRLAERVFDQLGAKPAEALVNLGIVRDRQGDGKKALELYRRGQERGARAPKLKEWIDVKERLLEARS